MAIKCLEDSTIVSHHTRTKTTPTMKHYETKNSSSWLCGDGQTGHAKGQTEDGRGAPATQRQYGGGQARLRHPLHALAMQDLRRRKVLILQLGNDVFGEEVR